jgi:hypothetical protein
VRGAFLIESGILVVGVEIAPPQKTKVRPFFAKQWYEKLPKSPATPANGSQNRRRREVAPPQGAARRRANSLNQPPKRFRLGTMWGAKPSIQ